MGCPAEIAARATQTRQGRVSVSRRDHQYSALIRCLPLNRVLVSRTRSSDDRYSRKSPDTSPRGGHCRDRSRLCSSCLAQPILARQAPASCDAVYAGISTRTRALPFDSNELKVARSGPANKPRASGDDIPPWRCGLRQFTGVLPPSLAIGKMWTHRYAGRCRRFGARGLQRRPGLRASPNRDARGLAGPRARCGGLAIGGVVAGLRFDAAR